MYGDGCITDNDTTRISIHKNDENLILALHKAFPFFMLGEYDYSKHNINSGKQVSITKSSKELYQDLLSNGVYPRKSYDNKELLKVPSIDDVLLPHFIRGFFDADGSVYTQANRPNLIRIEFCCVSKTFIYELDSYLRNIGINSWKVTDKKPTGGSKQMLYVLTFTKTIETMKLIEYMYSGSTISMERKAEKCLNYVPVDKVGDRNMKCPKCHSRRIKKNGIRNGNRRYICQDCRKGITIKNNFN
jgi:intein/homing endonuclease